MLSERKNTFDIHKDGTSAGGTLHYDDSSNEGGSSELKVPDIKSIDDFIAGIDGVIADAQSFMKAMFGENNSITPEPNTERKNEFATKPIKIKKELVKQVSLVFVPIARTAIKRRAAEEKTQAPLVEEKPKKKFKLIPVSFP